MKIEIRHMIGGRNVSFVLLFWLASTGVFAQNMLSPIWDIQVSDTAKWNAGQTGKVNLLLSWERQHYSWLSGSVVLTQHFKVPKSQDDDYQLSLSMQCQVLGVYINETSVGQAIPNRFWTDKREEKTIINVPKDVIKPGKDNVIQVIASDLSYTGGLSYNTCALVAVETANKAAISIQIPAPDATFTAGKSVELALNGQTSEKGQLRLIIRNSFQDTVYFKKFKVKPGAFMQRLDLSKEQLVPGFYECIVVLDNGCYAGNVAWFGVQPDKIENFSNAIPEDYETYWVETKEELHQIKPDFSLTQVDSLSTAHKLVYVASMQSLGNTTIYGYYVVPRGKSNIAAIMQVPGYGYNISTSDVKRMAEKQDDIAEFALCIRGHGLSKASFNPWDDISFWGYKICDKNDNVYRGAYMDCVRGVEFLISRPEVDNKRIGVMGGSQGGGLTLATAGLCADQIAACAYFDPFPCDLRDHLRIRKMINGELHEFLKDDMNSCSFGNLLDMQDYIDTRGFASKIKCPVFFSTALFDDDCPPYIGFAAYNQISTQKQYKIYPKDSHLSESGEYDAMYQYLKSALQK